MLFGPGKEVSVRKWKQDDVVLLNQHHLHISVSCMFLVLFVTVHDF